MARRRQEGGRVDVEETKKSEERGERQVTAKRGAERGGKEGAVPERPGEPK